MRPFIQASRDAQAVVVARFEGSDAATHRFRVVETLRGSVASPEIQVAKLVWRYAGPQVADIAQPDTLYLMLLNVGNVLQCGHLEGTPILCGTCYGILPIVRGSLSEDYRWRYDGTASGVVPLEKIRSDVLGAAR